MSTPPQAKPESEGAPRLRLMREQLDDLDALLDKMLDLPLPAVAPSEPSGPRLAVAEEEDDPGLGAPPLLPLLPAPPSAEVLAVELAATEARLTPAAESPAPPMPPPPPARTMTFLEQPMRPEFSPARVGHEADELPRPGWLLNGLGWLGILLLLGAAALTLGRWLARSG